MRLLLIVLLFICSCNKSYKVFTASKKPVINGAAFYEQALKMQWQQRDSLALYYLLEKNIPNFLEKFVPIQTSYTDTANQIKHSAIFYVSKDYVSIGSNSNWARIPLTPISAQKVATAFNCFLPTAKMVDSIYKQATVKLAPMPLYIYRDSSITMWQHHLIIEGQRQQQKGLIAGIKKDIVISNKILQASKQNKVAIYGWHLLNGKPIQPVYAGHVNWYADYSHGVRLVYNKIKINGAWMYYEDVLKHPIYKWLLTNETGNLFVKYPDDY
jgi:hypothetical protein